MFRRSVLLFAIAALVCLGVPEIGFSESESTALPIAYPEEWGVPFGKARSVDSPASWPVGAYSGFEPGTTVLPKGSVFPPAKKALETDIVWDRDVPILLRDGTTLYADLFRPARAMEELPVIIAWTVFGKSVPQDPNFAFQGSVPSDRVSGLNVFEGPDPAFWCARNYAVLAVDQRGAFASEGNIHYWGLVDAADGYEVIEWAGSQDWSNGKVAMAGNSWLAIAQWHIAALQPPHLTAIAPWNGLMDVYRDDMFWGGIPAPGFNAFITNALTGKKGVELPYALAEQNPLWHPYWQDKMAQVEEITIPVYAACGLVEDLHRMGTFEAFRRIGSKDKWLRVFTTGEWYDQYVPENEQDLLRFFDHYLKGIDNGWEQAPVVRVSTLDLGGVNEINRPEKEWPLARTQYQRYYLDAKNGTLSLYPAKKTASVAYGANDGQATFSVTFDEDTEITGYLKLHLYVEAVEANDMDLFAIVQKLDVDGNPLVAPAPPPAGTWAGTTGKLRVSLRAIDYQRSTHFLPVHTFTKNQPLSPGEIVKVDMAIWPTSMLFHAGETLRLTLAGDVLAGNAVTINQGKHVIHTGLGEHSYLQLPVIPRGSGSNLD